MQAILSSTARGVSPGARGRKFAPQGDVQAQGQKGTKIWASIRFSNWW